MVTSFVAFKFIKSLKNIFIFNMAYKRVESYDQDITEGLIKNYKANITLLGEDAEREGLIKTPERIAKAMQYITQGYTQDAKAILESAKFHEEMS
jgi:GTP cyclohydrolase IA